MTPSTVLIAFLLAAFAAIPGEGDPVLRRSRRMINGEDVSPNEFPWIVSVQTKGQHLCGGVLIRRDFVLTAAHCLVNNANVTVIAGLHGLHDQGVQVNGTGIMQPLFNINTLKNDIALIRLHNAVPLSPKVQTIGLPSRSKMLKVGDTAEIAGWGDELTKWDRFKKSSKNSPQPARRATAQQSPIESRTKALKKLSLRIANYTQCIDEGRRYSEELKSACQRGQFDQSWCNGVQVSSNTSKVAAVRSSPKTASRPYSIIPATSICAVSNELSSNGERKSPCTGDSGSPLMVQSADGFMTVVGVASWSLPDCIIRLKAYPQLGFYAEVFSSLDWIRSVTGETEPALSRQKGGRRNSSKTTDSYKDHHPEDISSLASSAYKAFKSIVASIFGWA